MYLAMPEEHLGWRGHFAPRKNETPQERNSRKAIWDDNQRYLGEWKARFLALGEEKDKFIGYISDNNYTVERYLEIKEIELKKLFIHYFTIPTLLKALFIDDESEKAIITGYITKDFPLIYDRMIRYVADRKLPYSILEGAFRTFGAKFAESILNCIDYSATEEPFVINNLIKAQKKAKLNVFKFELVRTFFLYKSVGALTKSEISDTVEAIKGMNEAVIRSVLAKKFSRFKTKLIKQATGDEIGATFIAEQIEQQLDDFCRQLSLFEDM